MYAEIQKGLGLLWSDCAFSAISMPAPGSKSLLLFAQPLIQTNRFATGWYLEVAMLLLELTKLPEPTLRCDKGTTATLLWQRFYTAQMHAEILKGLGLL